jgi:hypothetical protein
MRRGVQQERKSILETRASELKALEAESSPETGIGALTVSADKGASAQQTGNHHLCTVGLIVQDFTAAVLILAAEDIEEDVAYQASQEEAAAANQLP